MEMFGNVAIMIEPTQQITLVDNQTNEEYTGIVSSKTHDIVSLKNVSGFRGTAIFMLNQFKLKA